jgi:ATP-binding cassette, subfamily B, multidrug efflux pump
MERKIKTKRKGRRGMGKNKPSTKKGTLGRAIKYLGKYKKEAFLAYGALILATEAQLMVPQMVENIIDSLVKGFTANKILAIPAQFQATVIEQLGLTLAELQANSEGAIDAIIYSGTLIIIFAIIRGLFSFTQSYMGERVSQSVSFDFRNELFSKIQRLSFSYHDKHRTGQLMIRATDDVEKVRTFIGQGLLMAVGSVWLMTRTLAILLTTNSKLTMKILPVLPIAMLLFMIFGMLVRPMFEKVQKKLSAMNSILQENMAGIKVVKAFSREKFREHKFDVASTDYMNQMINVMRVMTFLMPSIFLLANIGQVVILYYGGGQIINGTLTLGEYQKFSLYLVFIFIPVGQLGFIITQMAQAAASASRVFEILDTKNEIEDAANAVTLPSIEGKIKFDDVSFRYFGGDDPVLKNLNFEAEPGQTIALLGMTGSGKSTVINLIPRFYDPSEGKILVDEQDIKSVKVDSLREQIGIVLQETTLFSGTIRDNIAFGRPSATDEEVENAAKAAAAHEFVMGFPEQYKTPVGERGSTLSGGQKQRIAIARALLLNPKILILDDSTSSVDLQTEYLIQQALDKLMEGRTSFVIAQRISTVLNADQIIVLDQGEIAAIGNHEDLMENSEIYSEIYHSQLMESTKLDDDLPNERDAGEKE